jgi:hypothetical protein
MSGRMAIRVVRFHGLRTPQYHILLTLIAAATT